MARVRIAPSDHLLGMTTTAREDLKHWLLLAQGDDSVVQDTAPDTPSGTTTPVHVYIDLTGGED